MKVADELGYCGPDPAARTLRKGKSGSYGILLTESLSYAMTDPAAVILLQGIAEVFDEKNAGLLVLAVPGRSLDRSRSRPKRGGRWLPDLLDRRG